jgi:bleomycin hydrolase
MAKIPKRNHNSSNGGGRKMPARSPGAADTAADGQLTPQVLAELRRGFEANPTYKLAMNAVTQTPIDDVALNRGVVTTTDFTFSHWLDDWAVTNQKQSGRCWMFAGLNLLRVGAMKKMKLREFEFSQNYTLFWDKFERANYFLEKIIETAARPVDDRVVAFLLSHPLDDGGQWNMFVNIVRKYGLVPKAVMPETESSSSTWRMNSLLVHKLREGAKARKHCANFAPAGFRWHKPAPPSTRSSTSSTAFSASISELRRRSSSGNGTTSTGNSIATAR